MSATPDSTSDDDAPPALGSRENFWGDDSEEIDVSGGHQETTGTSAAAYVAHQLLLDIVSPVCGKTGIELSDPEFYLPKQTEHSAGYIEYGQHRHRRRVNHETGFINWGETTSTDVPPVDYETYRLAVHTYLAKRECRLTEVDEYLERAECFWHDPSMDSAGSLEHFVAYVREQEDN